MKKLALIALAALATAHAAPTRTATEGYVDRTVAAATNALEGVGTDRQIIRGSNQYGPWNISVFDAQTAQTAQGDLDGRSIIDTYAEKMVVNDLHDQVNSLGDHYNELDGALEQMVADVGSLAGTIGPHVVDTNNPHKVTSAQVGALPLTGGTMTGDLAVGEEHTASRRLTVAADNGANGITLQGGTSYGSGSSLTIGGSSINGGTLTVQGGGNSGGIIEVTGSGASIRKDGKEVATESYVDAKVENAVLPTNPTFSNAVLAVGLNIDTNSVAVLNEIASTFGGFSIEGTATTVGGLLAALAAAVAWLRKNKVQTIKLNDGSVEKTAENGVAKLDDFFTESNSILTGTIDARLPYPLYAVPSTGLLKDRTLNTTSLASVTVPDNFTDLLVRTSVASSLSVTMPDAITKYGDTFPGEAGEYLITITKTGAAEAYVRTIKLEVANA